MRKVDYVGSKPLASTLLFSPSPLDSEDGKRDEDDLGDELRTMETLKSENACQGDGARITSA